MKHSHARVANITSASQEISPILWNREFAWVN